MTHFHLRGFTKSYFIDVLHLHQRDVKRPPPAPPPLSFSPAGLAGCPVISDISLIRLSSAAVATADSPFSPHHPYTVSPHMEQYLRSVHGGPSLSMLSAARGLSPADCEWSPPPHAPVIVEVKG